MVTGRPKAPDFTNQRADSLQGIAQCHGGFIVENRFHQPRAGPGGNGAFRQGRAPSAPLTCILNIRALLSK